MWRLAELVQQRCANGAWSVRSEQVAKSRHGHLTGLNATGIVRSSRLEGLSVGSLCQATDVGHHVLDFVRLHALAIAGHLRFALFDDPGEIVVARFDYLRVRETTHFGTLAGRRIAFPVSAVACSGFRFVS